MKKLSALLLSLLLLLTACGTPATPGDAVTLPTPNDEILVEEGLHAEDLPEVCRLWFDLAETSGAADKNSKLPLAPVPTRRVQLPPPSACRAERTPISFRRQACR